MLTKEFNTLEKTLAQLDDLLPIIKKYSDEIETSCRQPEELIQTFKKHRLLRLLMPGKWDGMELDFQALYKPVAKIAAVEPSTGWCYGLLVLHSWMLTFFSEKAQQEVWETDRDATIASSFGALPGHTVKRCNGGYEVSGRWGFSSGIHHSDWLMISTIIPTDKENSEPAYKMMLVPRNDFTILDTWHTVAQRGTGSNNVELSRVFIPTHRTIDLVKWCQEGLGSGDRYNDNHLYQKPLYSVLPICLTSALLGATKGTYNMWLEGMKNKTTVRGAKLADFTHLQIRLASIAGIIEAAEALFEKTVNRVCQEQEISTYERLRLRRNYGMVAKLCKEATQEIIDHGGAGTMFAGNPLQRFWRDIQASSLHITFNMDHLGEMFGKCELGIPLDEKDQLLS